MKGGQLKELLFYMKFFFFNFIVMIRKFQVRLAKMQEFVEVYKGI